MDLGIYQITVVQTCQQCRLVISKKVKKIATCTQNLPQGHFKNYYYFLFQVWPLKCNAVVVLSNAHNSNKLEH